MKLSTPTPLFISIFLILFFKISVATSPTLIHHWIVWNVGQGQWITFVENSTCSHFDFGGEVYSIQNHRKRFFANCKNKSNQLYLSHADLDHYSFYNFIVKNSVSSCWQFRPQESLKQLHSEIPLCAHLPTPMKVLYSESKTKNSLTPVNKKRNDTSTVIQIQKFLIPGDSPSQKEKIWAKDIHPDDKIEILILGHHGSKTSSSEILLSRLNQLKMTIASSRSKKYGHPHKKVIERLNQYRLKVIRTEDWGTLMIQ